jgi:hypothetical protein
MVHTIFCADDVNILGGRVYTKERNKWSLLFASEQIGLDMNSDKTNYMVMYEDQSAGGIDNIKCENSSFGIT